MRSFVSQLLLTSLNVNKTENTKGLNRRIYAEHICRFLNHVNSSKRKSQTIELQANTGQGIKEMVQGWITYFVHKENISTEMVLNC